MTLQSRAVDTRNTILNSALTLFSQNGYDATSVAEICHKANVSKGAFYHHFPSKQALFLALLTSWLDEVDGLFQLTSQSAVDVSQSLQLMAAMSGQFFDALEGGFPILLEFWTQASRHPTVWKQAVAPYHHYLDFFETLIATGIEQGVFDQDLNTDTAARIIIGMAMGLLLQAAFDPDYKDWQSVTSMGIKIILNGLRRTI
ncbi:MAG: TetR/AcrR family transcriptional regulator [Anaerolineales bacterium]